MITVPSVADHNRIRALPVKAQRMCSDMATISATSNGSGCLPEHGEEPAACLVRGVVISLDRDRSGPMLRRLRSARALPPMAHRWGSPQAYEELLDRPRSLALLDVPAGDWTDDDLEARVALLQRLAPVVVLVPATSDPAVLLRAGAVNVLRRDLPVRELAVRLAADQRWMATSVSPPWGRSDVQRHHELPMRGTQRLLMRLLLSDRRPWCCHDLSLLLSRPEQPLSRPALRARMLRLDPYLAAMGLSLCRTGTWGRFTYTVRRLTALPSST
jgi:hypothetical protein